MHLPDGRVQRVLVPQLYALVDPNAPTLSAGLISAKGTTINLSGGLFNSGTLAARDNLAINAGSITNVLGQMQGQNIDLRASGGITSILGQIAARQNLSAKARGDMVFVGGGIKAGGNARLSAGGDLLLLAYDTGRQVRAQSARDENGNPVGKGPVWSFENSTYNQTGVDIKVGGSLSASAGKNLVAQGVNAKVGGSTSLRAGGDMQLTTALKGHVNTFDFYNKYKSAGDFLKISQRINSRDIDLQNSGNSWNSGGGVNLQAGGNLSLVGAQINSQGYSASAGGSYQERSAYDVKENVHIETTQRTGPGVYLADATNNTLAITTLGEQGGKTEKDRTETHIDSTRTAIVTDINAGAGAVNRNAGGDVLIEGSIVRGGEGLVDPVNAGGKVTAVAAVDTRHIEDSVFTSSIRWQSTKSTGSIGQTLHMPEIHGLPAHMSAYQGAGGVSVQLPAGSYVRSAIETLSQKPGQGYLKELGKRSDIDWQRVEELNKSLDFSKSGLTQEATIVVIIVVSILTYGAASSAGGAAGNAVAMGAGEGVAMSGGGTFLTATGTTISGAAGAAVTAGITSLASTAAVSLINNKGDLGATLKELGSEDNAKGLLLTMATAGLSNGILNQVGLSGVDANSTVGQLFARNTIQGITSAVLESAVMGTNLEDALKNNLKGALINTVAAQGADEIGDAQLDATSKALAHALLGCAMGAATAGSSSGCAPGATGAVIGEIVAGLYAEASGYDQLKIDANKPGASAELQQQLAVVTNTMTELAKLTGAGGALLIGGDASTMQTAMTTAQNAAVNNRQLHADEMALIRSNAQRYADQNQISVAQAERELTQQALKQVNSAYASNPDNARAAAFLSDLTRGGANFYQQTGQTLFNETSNAALYNNHALNAQFLSDPGMQALYNLAQRPGAGPNQFDGAAYALTYAAGDTAHLDQLSSSERMQVLNAMLQAGNELRVQGSTNAGVLAAATDRLAGHLQILGDLSLDQRLQISKDAFVALAVGLAGAGAGTNLQAVTDARAVVAGKTAAEAAQAAEAAAAATRARVENNFSRDGDSFYATTYGNLKDATAQARTQLGTDGFDAVTGKPVGNVATAEINVYGKPGETVQASSRVGNDATSTKDGFVSLPPEGTRIFKPEPFPKDPIPRQFDTEYKILENFAQKYVGNPQVQGNINLYTERAPCTSCTNVIERQFVERFPNMEVRVYHGNGEVTMYKGNQTQSYTVPNSNKEGWPTVPGGEVVPPRKP